MDDKEIERLAIEELEREAKHAADRAKTIGLPGWQRCPLPQMNKRFLHNTILSTLTANKKPCKRLANHGRKSSLHSVQQRNTKQTINQRIRKHSSSHSPENRKKHRSTDLIDEKRSEKGESSKQCSRKKCSSKKS